MLSKKVCDIISRKLAWAFMYDKVEKNLSRVLWADSGIFYDSRRPQQARNMKQGTFDKKLVLLQRCIRGAMACGEDFREGATQGDEEMAMYVNGSACGLQF